MNAVPTLMAVTMSALTSLDHLHAVAIMDAHSLPMEDRVQIYINEYSAESHNWQHQCINTNGGFLCFCNSGYQLNSDGRTCSDSYTLCMSHIWSSRYYDACSSNTDSCDHVCTNAEGFFQCCCNDGHALQSDGRTCTDNNECLLVTHNCEQLCVNSVGGFRCDCNLGYQRGSDGANCSGIIYLSTVQCNHRILHIRVQRYQCTNNSGGCQQICFNTDGSFLCHSENGYLLDGDERNCSGRLQILIVFPVYYVSSCWPL